MKKLIALTTATVVASLSFLTLDFSSAFADDNTPPAAASDLRSLFIPKHTVTIIDEVGEYDISDVDPLKTLGEMLADGGLDIASYRNGDNTELNPKLIVPVGKQTKIYRVASASTTQIITLPFQTIKEETDEVLKGETKVKTKGVVGKALKTVVVKTAGTDKTKAVTEENLVVLEAPKSEIVLVGTKEIKIAKAVESSGPLVSEAFVYGAGVGGGDNPDWAKNDQATIESTFNNTSDKPLVALMLEHVGKPYVWATQGPNTFDCSGLVYYVMNKSGHKIPRITAVEYGKSSTPISKSELVPGDIVWTPVHIGLYAGNGKVVHAANSRVGVVVTDLSWFEKRGYSYGRLG